MTIQGKDLNTGNGYSTSGMPSDSLNVTNTDSGGAGIGSDANGSGGNISIGTGVILTVNYSGTGAAIGSGAGGSIGNIQAGYDSYPMTVTHNTDNGNAIGYGVDGTAGDITFADCSGFHINCVETLEEAIILRMT